MNSTEYCEDPFLILAGVSKAGTTSQFRYLADHPEVCACVTKSPFYFLPVNFPAENGLRYGRDPLSAYLSTFPDSGQCQIRFEASPLYFHAPGVAEVIRRVLPNSRIVISLREPASRLMSYHQMAIQLGWLPPDLSFDQYVREAFRQRECGDVSPHYTHPLEEGRYADRLLHWLDTFGRERVMPVLFDDLRASPRSAISSIAQFAGIDSGFYERYAFRNRNPGHPGREFRTSYLAVHRLLSTAAPPGSPTRKALTAAARRLGVTYRRLITRPRHNVRPSEATLRRLRQFYADDVRSLTALMGRRLPWFIQYERGEARP